MLGLFKRFLHVWELEILCNSKYSCIAVKKHALRENQMLGSCDNKKMFGKEKERRMA